MSLPRTIELVTNYVAVQCGVRRLAPDASVKGVYLPAVAARFKEHRVVNNFGLAVKSDEVKLVLAGFQRFYRKHNPAASNMKVAYGMDLALASRNVIASLPRFRLPDNPDAEQMLRERMFTIQAFGIMFMLRRSEHVYSKSGQPPLRRNHLLFWDASERRIPYEDIGKRAAVKLTINVEFSKADQSGFGRRPHHIRQPQHPEVCIVCLAERWVALTRDIFGANDDRMGVYHVPGFADPDMDSLHEVMEATVRSLGVEGYGIKATSHSLRYGGATMLAAAGFPQYLIAHYGGWKPGSASLERYARPSEESIRRVSEYMTAVALVNPSRHYIQDLIVRQKASRPRTQRGEGGRWSR